MSNTTTKTKHAKACANAYALIKNMTEDADTRDLFVAYEQASKKCAVCQAAQKPMNVEQALTLCVDALKARGATREQVFTITSALYRGDAWTNDGLYKYITLAFDVAPLVKERRVWKQVFGVGDDVEVCDRGVWKRAVVSHVRELGMERNSPWHYRATVDGVPGLVFHKSEVREAK